MSSRREGGDLLYGKYDADVGRRSPLLERVGGGGGDRKHHFHRKKEQSVTSRVMPIRSIA